ncbi:MAG: hypothetical protein QXF52_04640 [Thermoproteota archaeon]
MKNPLSVTLSLFFFTLFLLFLALFSPAVYNFSEGSKWLSVGDFAEYDVSLRFENATFLIGFMVTGESTAILRWEVIRETDGVVELAVSLNATGEAYWCSEEYNGCQTSWISIYKSIVLTVNVSSREAKYMGQDIGYVPFWIEKMPAKGQRIPMAKLENGDILYGEVNIIMDNDVDWNEKKARLMYITAINPDPDNFMYFFNSYDWYSGLALIFYESGNPVEYASSCCPFTLPNGTTIEPRRSGGTLFGKLFDLSHFCTFSLRSTSIKIGPPSREGVSLEIIMVTVFFTASGIVVAYVFLRQRTRRIVEEAENAGHL